MLYMQDPRDDDGHFAWIKNLSCFVRSQITRDKKKKFFCNRKMNDCAIRLPSVDKWLEFGNHCNKERVSFIVYADLECVSTEDEIHQGRCIVVHISTARGINRILRAIFV